MLQRIVLALLLVLTGSALAQAQTFTLPEIGLQNSGACPQIAVRERVGKTMVPLGYLDTTSKVIRWSGDGSGISLTPSASAASGTLARIVADKAPLANPLFVSTATVSGNPLGSSVGCLSTDGAYATDGTEGWEPTCQGAWLSSNWGNFVFPTRGTDRNTDSTPKKNHTTNSLVQAKSVGDQPIQRTAQFINLDVIGGAYSQANHDSQTNSVGQLISVRQHPDTAGNTPPYTWGQNIDVHVGPNSGATHTYGLELDLNNFNQPSNVATEFQSAWYFYGGINPYPNLAFHYFGNPRTSKFTGKVTTAGRTFTLTSGTFSPLIAVLRYAGTTYRVDCTTTTCTSDLPLATNATPGDFEAYSAMANIGLFFQEGPLGSQVKDHDFLMADSARTIMTAIGNHLVGLDFTGDALKDAARLKGGQNICYNGSAACMSFSAGINSWLFQSGNDQGTFAARIDTAGAGYFTNVTTSGAQITSVASIGAAGTTQATATALTASSTDIVVGSSGQGVRLNGTIGFRQEVWNSSGQPLVVYPATGQQIGAAGANVAVALASGSHAAFVCFSASQCRQAP